MHIHYTFSATILWREKHIMIYSVLPGGNGQLVPRDCLPAVLCDWLACGMWLKTRQIPVIKMASTFVQWVIGLGLELGLGASESFIAECRQGITGDRLLVAGRWRRTFMIMCAVLHKSFWLGWSPQWRKCPAAKIGSTSKNLVMTRALMLAEQNTSSSRQIPSTCSRLVHSWMLLDKLSRSTGLA